MDNNIYYHYYKNDFYRHLFFSIGNSISSYLYSGVPQDPPNKTLYINWLSKIPCHLRLRGQWWGGEGREQQQEEEHYVQGFVHPPSARRRWKIQVMMMNLAQVRWVDALFVRPFNKYLKNKKGYVEEEDHHQGRIRRWGDVMSVGRLAMMCSIVSTRRTTLQRKERTRRKMKTRRLPSRNNKKKGHAYCAWSGTPMSAHQMIIRRPHPSWPTSPSQAAFTSTHLHGSWPRALR